MFIDFYGGTKEDEPDRRHALRDRGDGRFQLIPNRDEIYRTAGMWSHGSVPHHNYVGQMVMQKIALPDENEMEN